MRRRLACWLAVGFFLYFSSLAQAASIAVARAWLDWSNFTIQTIDVGYGTPTIIWNTDVGEDVSAYVGEYYQSDSASDWSTPLNVSISQGGASASASVNNSQIYAYADPFLPAIHSGADASRYGEFTVSGTGIVMFQAPYHLEVSLSEGPSAYAYASAWLDLWSGGFEESSRYSYSGADLWKDLGSDGVGSWSDEGILVVALYFNDGETGYFQAGVDSYTSAAVPLPSALLLLGGGLIGIAGWRRIKA